MELDFHISAVLLGLAEVKVPFKKLTIDERERIVRICYKKLLDFDLENELDDKEKNLKYIGVVDSFYALQEVQFTVQQNDCSLLKKEEVILQHSIKDVIITFPADDSPSRLIIVSQTPNFGKTALVLQMQSPETVQNLIKRLSPPNQGPNIQRVPTNAKEFGKLKRGSDSLGRVMGIKVNTLLSSLGATGTDREYSQDLGMTLLKDKSPIDSPLVSEEEDEINNDSDADDSLDSGLQNHIVLSTPAYELSEPKQKSFDKASMTPLKAEIEYLIISEVAFVTSLKRLIDFKGRLYEATDVIKKKHTDQMLLYVEELYIFHSNLLNKLRSCNADIENICILFKENSDKFRYHVNYISNIQLAEKIFSSYRDVLTQINSSLGEDLRKPRMRMNHYILTFESLKKISDSTNNSKIQEVIDLFKVYLKEADTRIITDSVNLCPFNLIDYGFLVQNGELSLKRGEGFQKRRYQVLLLDRILVLARGRQHVSEYVASFDLRGVKLVLELRGVFIRLKVQQNSKSNLIIFKATSIKLQQKWIQKLKHCLENVNRESTKNEVHKCAKENAYLGLKDHDDRLHVNNVPVPDLNLDLCMPPLTLSMAFKHKNWNKKSARFNDNVHLIVRDIQDSEKLLIKNLDHILSQNKLENEDCEISECIRHFYEFHLRYFHCAIPYDKERFDEYLSNCILKRKKMFKDSTAKMLFLASALKYDGKTEFYFSVFEVAVENFFKYKHYFSRNDFACEELQNPSSVEEIAKVFEDTVILSNKNLKKKYILDYPVGENVLMEGFVRVNESLEDVHADLYIILTKQSIYFLSTSKETLSIHTSFRNENGRLGNPTGIKSFQIKFFSTGERTKRKFNFTLKDVKNKAEWVSAFETVLPQELKRKDAVRFSGRIKTNKSQNSKTKNLQKETGSVEGLPAALEDRKFNGYFMESDL